MKRIALLLIAPKKVGADQYMDIIKEGQELLKIISYYHGSESLNLIDPFFAHTLGANNYLLSWIKTLGYKTTNLANSIYDSDVAIEDFSSLGYMETYILALWDGVDESVRKEIISANKFGYNVRIKMIKRWQQGEKVFV